MSKMTEDFEREIDKVISGEIKYAKSNSLISPSEVDTYLKGEGLIDENFDSNGDLDFCMTYSKDEKKFELSGSGWYNKGLTFSRIEDE